MSIQQSMNQLLNTASAMGAIYAHTPEHQGRLATKKAEKRIKKAEEFYKESETKKDKRIEELVFGAKREEDLGLEDFLDVMSGITKENITSLEEIIASLQDLYQKNPSTELRQRIIQYKKDLDENRNLRAEWEEFYKKPTTENLPQEGIPREVREELVRENNWQDEINTFSNQYKKAIRNYRMRTDTSMPQFPTQPQRTKEGHPLPPFRTYQEEIEGEEVLGEDIDLPPNLKKANEYEKFQREVDRVNQERIEETQRMRQNQDLQNMTEEVSGEELPLPLQLNETFEDLRETVKPTAEVDDNTGGEIQMPQTQPKPRPKPQLKPRQLAEQQSFEGLRDAIDSTRQSREGLEARKQFLLDARNSTIGGNQ